MIATVKQKCKILDYDYRKIKENRKWLRKVEILWELPLDSIKEICIDAPKLETINCTLYNGKIIIKPIANT